MNSNNSTSHKIPDMVALKSAIDIAIAEDKPIMMDYWIFSIEKKAFIGVKSNGDRLLVKNEEEYTSPISKIFKSANEYVIKTENSIYIVDVNIPIKKIDTES